MAEVANKRYDKRKRICKPVLCKEDVTQLCHVDYQLTDHLVISITESYRDERAAH
jgi:hypothetical protein